MKPARNLEEYNEAIRRSTPGAVIPVTKELHKILASTIVVNHPEPRPYCLQYATPFVKVEIYPYDVTLTSGDQTITLPLSEIISVAAEILTLRSRRRNND